METVEKIRYATKEEIENGISEYGTALHQRTVHIPNDEAMKQKLIEYLKNDRTPLTIHGEDDIVEISDVDFFVDEKTNDSLDDE